MAAEQFQVLPHLTFCIQSPTSVVQIDVLLGINASILRSTEGIKGSSGIKGGILPPECSQSHFSGGELCSVWVRHESSPSGDRVLQHMLRQEFPTCSSGE